MNVARTVLLTTVSLIASSVLGELVVAVDRMALSREDIFEPAEKIISHFDGEYDGLRGQDAWRQLVEDIVLDFKVSVIALEEVKSRNIRMPAPIDFGEFKQNSVYQYFPRNKVETEYFKACAIAMLAKADYGENVKVDRSIKRSLLARYQGKHEIKEVGLNELLDSYGNVSTGKFVKGSEYEADKVEIGKNAGAFTKIAFFVHRYTVRYYVMGMRWYVRAVRKMSLNAKVNGNKKLSELIDAIGIFVIPVLLFATLGAIALRRWKVESKLKFKRIVGFSLTFYLVSVALYYFGMSVVSMYITFVLLPLMLVIAYVFRDSLFKVTPHVRARPILYQVNPKNPEEDGGPGTGYWYTSSGEKVWNGDD
jgi:hypothetical protein